MWINPLFSADTREALTRLATSSSLATVVAEAPLRAAHLPVLVRNPDESGIVLVGHVPVADPVSSAVDDGRRLLVVFHGPRAYVSAGWYADVGLPTYNFAVAHLSGPSEQMTQEELRNHLLELITVHERTKQPGDDGPWSLDERARQRLETLLPRIRGFRIRVDEAQAKEKFGQNRSADDRLSTIAHLARSPADEHHDVAEIMTGRQLHPSGS